MVMFIINPANVITSLSYLLRAIGFLSKGTGLLVQHVGASCCFVGHTFNSFVRRGGPDLFLAIFAVSLFIGLTHMPIAIYHLQRMQIFRANRGRVRRRPADPPAPANTNDAGTNTDGNNDAHPEAEGDAETIDAVAQAGTNVEAEANNTEIERLKAAINAALEELMCPITFDLPVDPVVTEAGDVCDREAITALIQQRGMRTLRSMRTNQPMGRHIAPSVAIRNVIEKLVESGAVDEDVATAWRSGRENLEGRRNDAELPRREHDAGWFGFGAFGRFMEPDQQEAMEPMMERIERLRRHIAELEQR